MPMHTIRFEGSFDYYGLFEMLYRWFSERMWSVTESKAVHSASGGGADREIKWKAGVKATEYIEYEIGLNFLFKEFKPAEKDSTGKQLYHARFFIEIEGAMTTDWQGIFEQKSGVSKKLGKWYEGYVNGAEIGALWEDKLYYTILQLYNDIKTFLNMESRGIS